MLIHVVLLEVHKCPIHGRLVLFVLPVNDCQTLLMTLMAHLQLAKLLPVLFVVFVNLFV